VNALRVFVERFPGMEGHFFFTLHLHHDRALQNIDESLRIVAVHRISAARSVIHSDHGHLFPWWNIHQIFGHQIRDLSVAQIRDLRLVRCLGAERRTQKENHADRGMYEKARAGLSFH
jgi:hypothetical protein